MKKLIVAGLMVAALVLASVGAYATTFTLNEAALENLWEVYENPENAISDLLMVTTDESAYGTTMAGDVGFVGPIYNSAGNPYDPFAQIGIGANFWGASGQTGDSGATTAQIIGLALESAPTNSLVGFDTYSLYLYNDNDDTWGVNIFMNTGYTDLGETDNFYENGWTFLEPGAGAVLSIDLASVVNLNHVTNIGLAVGGNMDQISNDPSNPDFFHVSASPVTEPGTMLLLGFGLAGLGFLSRKKFRIGKES